jgi:hypothetical protein
MTDKSTRVMQTFMITSVTRHQQRFSTRNTKVNGRNNGSGRHDAYLKEALKQGWRCAESWLWMRVSLLNISMYIFIVRWLSILSKLNSNNLYRICSELYFLNLNYLIILVTWLIWPSWRPQELIYKLIISIFYVHIIRGTPSNLTKL